MTKVIVARNPRPDTRNGNADGSMGMVGEGRCSGVSAAIRFFLPLPRCLTALSAHLRHDFGNRVASHRFILLVLFPRLNKRKLCFGFRIVNAKGRYSPTVRHRTAVRAQMVANGSGAAEIKRPISFSVKLRCSFFSPSHGSVRSENEKLPVA